MMNKMEFAQNILNTKIADAEAEVERYEKEIRSYTNSSSRYEMVTCLPVVCRKLEDAMNKLTQLNEQKAMLEFLSKED